MTGSGKLSKSQDRFTMKLAWLFLLLLTAMPGIAQLPTATVLGTVKDSTGAIVLGASLTARNLDTGQARTTVSGADGAYRFSALPVGTYEVRSEHPGFKAEVRSGMTLSVSEEAVVNFTLEVGTIEQTVSVTAEAPLVNTTSGSLGGLVDEQKVADLPLNGRNYTSLTLMQPGVEQHRTAVASSQVLVGVLFSANGATIHSNNYLLDGAIMQSFGGLSTASTTGSTLGVDGIREYRVVTSSVSAEYGMAMGSQTVTVTKGGTNTFHGSAFEYLRNSVLDARNFFDRITPLTPFRLPPFKRNNFGGGFGGPIKKDKTFFFGVYEGLRERLGVTTNDTVMGAGCRGAAGATITSAACPQLGTNAPSVTVAPQIAPLLTLFPLPNLPNNAFTFAVSQPSNENYGQIRVDQTISNNDTMFGRYTIDDTAVTQPLAYPQFKTIRGSRFQYSTLSESHVFSPALLNTARFSFSRTNAPLTSPSGISGPGFSFVQGQEIGGISIGAITGMAPNGLAPNRKNQNLFTWSDDLFYSHGRHSLKFGTLINRFQLFTLNGSGSKGAITFPTLSAFLQAQASAISGVTPGAINNRTYNYSTLGFYAQDDWKATPRLTLNLGLRYEFNTLIQEVRGYGAAIRDVIHDATTTLGPPALNPSLHNFSPRFGFAWDIMGNGKTALRGGFGLLYDIANLGNALSAGVNATPPFSSQSTFANPPTLTFPLTFPASAAGKGLRILDYHINQPHMYQFNVTVDRQLLYDIALSVAYAGSRGFNIIRVEDANPTIPTVLPDGRQFWTGNEARVNPNWTSIEFYTGGSRSWYNSLQVSLLKRLSKGLQFQTSYTWSKSMDTSQSQVVSENNATSDFLVDTLRPQVDKSLSSFNTPQNLRFNLIYHLPEVNSMGGVMGKFLSGWWMSGILSLQSGNPLSPTLQTERSRSKTDNGIAGVDRPDLVPGRNNSNIVSGTTAGCPGVAARQKLGTPTLYYDPCAFTLQDFGFLGTAGRNILIGPGVANLDYSLVKDTSLRFLGESGRLEFRAEIFNILNRANFNSPDRTVFAGSAATESVLRTAGQITSTLTTSRQIQFALKVLF